MKNLPQQSLIPEQIAPAVLRDIEGEPAAIEAFVRGYTGVEGAALGFRQIDETPWDRLLFIGMGSSAFAARDCALSLRHKGLDAHAELASAQDPQPPSRRTLCVVISASGTTPETLGAFERHRGVSTTVAITSPGQGPLARADIQLPLIGVSTQSEAAVQSFQLSIALLQMLEAQVVGEPIGVALDVVQRGGEAIADLLESRSNWLESLAELTQSRPIFLAAPFGRTAAADQGALLLREGPRIFADSVEIGDWSHSDVYLSARPGYQLLLFGESSWEPELLDWMRKRERPIVVIGDRGRRDAALRIAVAGAAGRRLSAIAETTVVELLSVELWNRLLLKGVDPKAKELLS